MDPLYHEGNIIVSANLKIKKEFQTSLLEGWARHTAFLKRHKHLKPF